MDDLEQVLRWERAGGSWRILARGAGWIEVMLCACDGQQEMARLRSTEPALLRYCASPQ